MATFVALRSNQLPTLARATPRPETPWSRAATWWWLGSVGTLSLMMTLYRHLDRTKGGLGWPFRRTLIDETTAVVGAGLLFFGVRELIRRYPLNRQEWLWRLPLYGLGIFVFSGLHTAMNSIARKVLYPLVGLQSYNYGPGAFVRELPIDIVLFLIMVAVIYGARQTALGRAKALEAARLAKALSEARLDALTRSLEPHFLFNSLNTISATMYRDIEAADEMIEHLADLLRAALARDRAVEVTVREELEALQPYLALMRARFEERLQLTVDADDAVQNAQIPALLLQPLIENAVRHGGAEQVGQGRIEVTIERRDERLRVCVEDDGPGAPPGVDPLTAGHGLRTTAERLRLLHDKGHNFAAGNLPGGGFRVVVTLPYREVPYREVSDQEMPETPEPGAAGNLADLEDQAGLEDPL